MPADPKMRAKLLAGGLRLACIAAEGVSPSMRGRVSEGCAQVPTDTLREVADLLTALSAQPSGEGERERAHRRVTEYDGAYWCLDCGAKWGALPGKPQMPARCSAALTSPPASAAPADGGEALRERLIDALNMERYWTGGLDPTETFVDRFLASLSRSPARDDSNGGGA